MKSSEKLSKFIALALRHKPAKFGLTLDEEGFAEADDVLLAVITHFSADYAWEDILAVIHGDQHGKKRYELRDDKIRALYGHSIGNGVAVRYPPAIPPDYLYHGTSQAAAQAIEQQGLVRQQRQYVHLTTSHAIAQRVASRHSHNTVILRIHALAAHTAGCIFHHPEAEHYLAISIPAEFINAL